MLTMSSWWSCHDINYVPDSGIMATYSTYVAPHFNLSVSLYQIVHVQVYHQVSQEFPGSGFLDLGVRLRSG